MKYKKGDVVRHKINDLKIVILDVFPDSYKCRYFNSITGKYEVDTFLLCEVELAGNEETKR